ncbi:predicted protein [Lichtheimia corymbifera JMRC:FSU:9682]|uniref:Uncharacterized protein n=1 Tax=Lichtheimia corymbifera JMRC:FSU:9682 TaxID=1263082 RepID=A0A068SEI3_9FUNG|nr:predicted protein [Lichtheimia corymbifera JMRC:FSU:9682]
MKVRSSIEQYCSAGSSAPCVQVSRLSSPIPVCRRKKIQEVDPRFSFAGGDIVTPGIGNHDRETSTQDTFRSRRATLLYERAHV